MHFNPEEYDKILPNRNVKTASFIGLKGFVQNLEKHFFSKITVRDSAPNAHQISLVIELECDLTLLDMLLQSHKGNWGSFNQIRYSLTKELRFLEKENMVSIDVDEFSLILRDTTIIIDKIYNKSIAAQLDGIFNELDRHYLVFTKGNTEVPYEIFVAVYEEKLLQNPSTAQKTKKTHNYSSFWALYFETEENAVIYDLENSKIIHDNLFMLNQ